jgi:hypothetical protein
MEIVKDTTPVTTSYDPNKRYTWTPNDEFVLSGAEFGLLLNTFRAILSTEEAAKILMADRSNQVVESVLAKAVESGRVKEAPEENS